MVHAEPGWWVLIMDAAQGDPLKAQQMEENLSETWWERWLEWHTATAKVADEQARKAQARAKRR